MYCKVENGIATEYTLSQLRKDFPNVSFPSAPRDESLADYDIYPVTRVDAPVVDPATTKVVGYVISGSGATWAQVWSTAPLTPEEQSEYQSRQDRQNDIQALKSDPQVLQLLKARPDQINNYIDNNVSNLDSAKELLKIYGRALAVLAYTIVN